MSEIRTYSFCDNYIDKLCDYIEEHYIRQGRDLSRVAICFGGKRPALFIKRELSRRMSTPYYPPEFFTIDEFIAYLLNKHETFSTLLDLDNCYLVYQLARKVTPQILKGRESFAQFLPWTREILKFIDNLDLEDIPNSDLKNIGANAQIGYAVPEDINALLQAIVMLREAYHKTLRADKRYCRGLQYLLASQRVGDTALDEFDQVLFCNFFYFNRTEEIIVKNLHARGKATLLFQGDERKWPVLKKIARSFDSPLLEGEAPLTPGFKLHLYAGFDGHSQVGLVRQILRKVPATEETVIVLPGPDHIVGLLSEISAELKNFNVSMGYPLRRSSLYSLFEFVLRAQISRKKGLYYTKDYLKVLKHPFVKNLQLNGKDATVTRILAHKIEEVLTGLQMDDLSGSLFIALADVERCERVIVLTQEMLARLQIEASPEELRRLLRQLHEQVFSVWQDVRDFRAFAGVLEGFLDLVTQKSFLRGFPLNVHIAEKMYAIKEEFGGASFGAEVFTLDEMFKVFESKVETEIVKFQGSPLKGLQVLGLMETRSLNFKNVIVLDVNEGALPRLNIYEPLIPREVMISLNLDRLEMEEEIQRYQFMRLISSAKNVHLIYQQSKEKERSRFIEELIWERQKQQQCYGAVDVVKAGYRVKVAVQQKRVAKTPAMISALRQHKYSASSINMYVRDPMEFYYNYVLGLREAEDLLDEPEARRVGIFMHELLEEGFRGFLNAKPRIDAAFCKHMRGLCDERFARTFGRGMRSDAFLLKSVIDERLNRFLDNEAENPERDIDTLLYLEKSFDDVIPLSCGDIRFSYVVDRIDRLADGTILIIDYKTGSVGQMPKAIDRIASMELSREAIRDEIKSFQIPLYFYYLHKQYKDQKINAALYNLRTMTLEKFLDSRIKHTRDQINAAFLRPLDFVVSEILDPNRDFIEDNHE